MESGDYVDSLTNVHGCDSIVTLHLTINAADHTDLHVSACEEYEWKGVTYTETGNYSDTLTNTAGCDSVVTLHLTINAADHTDLHVLACGEYEWKGVIYIESGDYVDSLTNVHGCDSVVTLHLTIDTADHTDLHVLACEEYEWKGVIYTESGDYVDSLTNVHGCDSVVTLHLTINASDHTDLHVSACDEYEWGGVTYTESGDYNDTLSNDDGCDSTITLHLTINHSAETEEHLTLCENELPYTYQDTVFLPGIPELSLIHYQLSTSNGCDSVVTLHLTVIDTSLRIVSLTEDFCEGMSAELVAETQMTDYVWSTGEEMPNITVTQPGLYSVTAMQGDCRSTAHYTVEACDFRIVLPNAITPSRGDGVNDVFSLSERVQSMLGTFEISIFDRWGELVFYSTDKGFQWRGEINGRLAVSVVYNYVIRCTDLNGKSYRFTGSITVL